MSLISVCQRGYAKINLALDITGTREDGYHEIDTVMQTIQLWDEVTVSLAPAGAGPDAPAITIECNRPGIPRDERNLAYKAARLFMEKQNIDAKVVLHIFKKIPVSAGLAGGSADAAATLRAMNILFETKLPMSRLMEMGAEIGSDVPYCLIGGTCHATGRGEKVERVRPMPPAWVVLVNPDFGISTPRAYELFDSAENVKHPDIEALLDGIAARDWAGISANMQNVFESAVFPEHKILRHMRDDLLDKGAPVALLTGSGPTVYALFDNEKDADKAFRFMKRFYGSRYTVMERQLFFPWKKNDRFPVRPLNNK